jgi:penicillin-binding protein 2
MVFPRAPAKIKNEAQEQSLFRARALQALGVITFFLLLLLARFAWLQVYAHSDYVTKSDSNRIRTRAIAPPRGLIFDRHGALLADNQLAYRLELVPEELRRVPGGVDALWREIAMLVALDEDARADFDRARSQRRKFEGVPVKLRLSEEEVARINLALHRLPGLSVVAYLTRRYPKAADFAHVVGYVGRLSESDLQRVDSKRYEGTNYLGKSGIEAQYEDVLHGEPGYERVEVDASGRTVRVLKRVPAKAGQNVYLSIDAALQSAVMAAFGADSGAAVAIDPDTAQVLAFVSVPSYDPNLFVNGISQRNYQALLADPRQPTFNRALNGVYPPGSTFKPFMAVAGLELGLRTPNTMVLSQGVFYLPGEKRGYRDWKAGGHGLVNLREAMAQSVNTYFYQLAYELGIDRMHDYIGQFGFGRTTGIDLPRESTGLLPNKAWKQRVHKQPWYPGETVVCGIGQGQINATPLQLANASAILLSGGLQRAPQIVAAIEDPLSAKRIPQPARVLGGSFIRDANSVAAVVDSMSAVLHGSTGSARAVGRTSSYWMAGKTGTAQQVGNYQRNISAAVRARYKNQALFVGFAPITQTPDPEQPRIAVGLIVEQGGSGAHAAAPVARKIFDSYLIDGKRLKPNALRVAAADAAPVEAVELLDPDQALQASEAAAGSEAAEPVQPAPANAPLRSEPER